MSAEDTVTVGEGEAQRESAGTPPPAAADPGVQPADTADRDEVAALAAERDEYLDALRRLQAEFDNYRKRLRREEEAATARAAAAVIDRLLPVLDAFDAARAHHPEALAPVDGILHPALVALGVERIDPMGDTFDPEAHEAVAVNVEDETAGGGETVIEVLRPGYRHRGRLLRPAMVRVGDVDTDASEG